jgi:hypothetical protein
VNERTVGEMATFELNREIRKCRERLALDPDDHEAKYLLSSYQGELAERYEAEMADRGHRPS